MKISNVLRSLPAALLLASIAGLPGSAAAATCPAAGTFTGILVNQTGGGFQKYALNGDGNAYNVTVVMTGPNVGPGTTTIQALGPDGPVASFPLNNNNQTSGTFPTAAGSPYSLVLSSYAPNSFIPYSLTVKCTQATPADAAPGSSPIVKLVTQPDPAAPAPPYGTLSKSPTVNLSESGFSPQYIFIPAGGSVTWTNKGAIVHSVWSYEDSPTIDTGGMNPGSSITMNFAGTGPGVYLYTSSVDCQNGAAPSAFNCSPAAVVIVG